MKYLLALTVAIVSAISYPVQAETIGEKRIRQQAAQARAAIEEGLALAERFTASRGCEANQRQTFNDSRSSTRVVTRFRNDYRRQNRTQVQDFRRFGGGLPGIGPEYEIDADTRIVRRSVCESR